MNRKFEGSLHLNNFPIKEARQELVNRCGVVNNQQRAQEIYNFHKSNNKFYSAFLLSRVDKHELKWGNIPIVTKKDFQVSLDLVLGSFNKQELHIHNTSGSTGTPFYFAKDRFCHAMTWAYTDYRLLEHGINLGETLQARFYGIPLAGLKYYKERLKDRLAGRIRFPVFDLSEKKLEGVLKSFTRKPFVYFNGYTSSLVVFAKFLIKRGIVLKEVCPTLTLCMPTSEVCDDIDRQLLETGFGVKVVNEYGAAELDIIAMEDTDGDWVLNEETLFVEILDDNNQPVEPGQEGRVIVTSLYNKAMPFIRYELGDRAIISNKLKNGRRVLERVTGRVNDIIKLPSGKISPGLTFYYISKQLLEEGGKIKEFIIRQKSLDQFLIEYTAEEEVSEMDIANCKKSMDLYLEPGLNLTFKRVEFVERGKSGKLKHFFSEI